jgi:hypothetical protein
MDASLIVPLALDAIGVHIQDESLRPLGAVTIASAPYIDTITLGRAFTFDEADHS